MNEMTTVTRVLTVLKERGYTEDFTLADNCLVCPGQETRLYPDEFVVDKHYRFEGPSDPGDEAIVYAISSLKHNIKGTLVDGYGISSENISQDMLNALKENYALQGSTQDFNVHESDAHRKSNQATELRPEGDRVIDASLLRIDLNAAARQIKEEQTWKESDRNSITLFKSAGMRLVLIALHAGAELKTHTAPGLISVQVLEGEIGFKTQEQSVTLSQGEVVTLHKGIPHSVQALKESTFLLTMAIPS